MVLVTLLPYAVLQRADIAGMRQPSMAGVLESVVGPWGAVFVSVGLLVSVLGAYLAWALICAEVMFAAGKSKDMPKAFARVNQNDVPSVAMWSTSIIIQVIVDHDLLVERRVRADAQPDQRDDADPVPVRRRLRPDDRPARRDLRGAARGAAARPGPGRLAVVYTLFMIYAGGLKFILLSAILFAPGTILYFIARREQGKPVFAKTTDWVIFGVIVAACALRHLRPLSTGAISI